MILTSRIFCIQMDPSNGLNGDHEVDDATTKETENAEDDDVNQQQPLAGEETSKTQLEEDNTQTDENAGKQANLLQYFFLV